MARTPWAMRLRMRKAEDRLSPDATAAADRIRPHGPYAMAMRL